MRLELPGRDNSPRVEMIPLIDVVFLVLAAYIYTTLYVTQNSGVPVDLPESSEPQPGAPDPLVVTLTRDAEIFVKDRRIPPDQVDTVVGRWLDGHRGSGILVLGDRGTRLDQLVDVLDHIRDAGGERVTIATRRAQGPPRGD